MASDARSATTPLLAAVGGIMGSGKSTVARRLADLVDAELLAADETRRELHERGRRDALTPGFSPTLYRELLARAERSLRAGRHVVVDGTFRSRALRAAARRTADAAGATFLFVECAAPPALCRERMRERERAGEPGWPEMLEAFLREWEPVDELAPGHHARLDTAGGPDALEGPLLALAARARTLPA